MARALTTGEKAYQRYQGQWSKFYLTGLLGNTPPSTIYTALLGTPPTTTDDVTQIAFTGGSGTLANVLADMTVWVSSVGYGLNDLGECRIRKAPIAGTFYIAEVSDVNWLAGGTIYLTVVDDYKLVARQIYQSGPSTFLMDVDIAYSDQNTNPDPQPQMGCHRVVYYHGTLSAINTTTVTLGPESGNASFMIDGTAVYSITWSAVGPASVSFNNTNAANPVATIQLAGKYVLYCNVVGANGKSFQGVRYLFVHDNTLLPISTTSKVSLNCDFTTGGWYADITLPLNAGISNIKERTLAILFTEDFANISGNTGTQYTPASVMTGAENIALIGWIQDESIVEHPEWGEVTFRIQNAQYWMSQCTGFVVGVELNPTPSAWIHIPGLTVDLALYHICHWRSTISRIMDLKLTGDTRYAEAFEPSSLNLWDALNEISGSYTMGQPVIGAQIGIDKWNRLNAQIDPQLTTISNRASIPVVTDVFLQDIEGIKEPHNWKRNKLSVTSQVQMNGVSFDVNANQQSFFSDSPGHIYKRIGQPKTSENWLAFPTQAQNNSLAGYLVGWDNNSYPDFEPVVTSFIRAIDCFPNEYINLVIPSAKDPRGEGYSGNVIPRSIQVSSNPKTGGLKTNFTFEAVTLPELSSNGDAPGTTTPTNPNIPLPALPPIPSMPPPFIPGTSQNILIFVSGKGVFYTKDGGVNWFAMNGGLSDPTQVVNAEVTTSGACFCQVGTTGIYYAPSFGSQWQLIIEAGSLTGIGGTPLPPSAVGVKSFAYDLYNKNGGAWLYPYARTPQIVSFGVNRDSSDSIFVVPSMEYTIFGSYLLYNYVGSHSSPSLVSGTNWNSIGMGIPGITGKVSFGNNKWTVFWPNLGGSGGLYSAQFNFSGAAAIYQQLVSTSGGNNGGRSSRGRYSSNTVFGLTGTYFYISNDNAQTYTTLSPTPSNNGSEAIGSNGNGMTILMGTSTGLQKSTDGGVTWGSTSEAGLVQAVWNLGTDMNWLFTIVGQILSTTDLGTTFTSITGNLQSWIGALGSIVLIRTY